MSVGAEGNIGRGRGLKLNVEEVASGLTPGIDKERSGTVVVEVVGMLEIVCVSCPLKSSFLEEIGFCRASRHDPVFIRGGSGVFIELGGNIGWGVREGRVGLEIGLNLTERGSEAAEEEKVCLEA